MVTAINEKFKEIEKQRGLKTREEIQKEKEEFLRKWFSESIVWEFPLGLKNPKQADRLCWKAW